MSTLTKVLIVLLTTFSLVLCAIVVTYVAHAENQKERADGLQRNIRSAQEKQRAAEDDQAAAKKASEATEAKLKAEISDLNAKITEFTNQVAELNRLKDQATQEAAAQIARAELSTKTSADNTQLYMAAQQENKTLLAEQTNLKKELDELNVLVMEKMTLLAQLEEKNKQLAEANQDISNRLNQYLQQYGKMAPAPKLATPNTGIVSPVPPSQPVRDISLSGRVVNVDMQNNLAQISLGAASGVRPNMTFHVTRGEQYICDIVIKSVDPDKAVGQLNVLDRNRAEPRIGDAVSTNL